LSVGRGTIVEDRRPGGKTRGEVLSSRGDGGDSLRNKGGAPLRKGLKTTYLQGPVALGGKEKKKKKRRRRKRGNVNLIKIEGTELTKKRKVWEGRKKRGR